MLKFKITKLVLILWFSFLFCWKLSLILCYASVRLRSCSNPPDIYRFWIQNKDINILFKHFSWQIILYFSPTPICNGWRGRAIRPPGQISAARVSGAWRRAHLHYLAQGRGRLAGGAGQDDGHGGARGGGGGQQARDQWCQADGLWQIWVSGKECCHPVLSANKRNLSLPGFLRKWTVTWCTIHPQCL